MIKITAVSLAGGQGKTTLTLFLGKLLGLLGKRVLLIDADPQANLTLYTGVTVSADRPSLLEVLEKKVNAGDAVYHTPFDGVSIIPSDRGLEAAHVVLARGGVPAFALKSRLKPVEQLFHYCLIDAPPSGNMLTLTSLAAADFLLIPVETSVKGVESLGNTLKTVFEMEIEGAFSGEILGVMPFRLRFVGSNMPLSHASALESIKKIAESNGLRVWNPIRESEAFQKAVNSGKMPGDFKSEIETSIREIAECLVTDSI